MPKKFAFSYLLIFIALLISMSLSRSTTEKVRGGSVSWLAPIWEKLLYVKHKVVHPLEPPPSRLSLSLEEEKLKLELENQLLTNELAHLHQLFHHHQNLQKQLSALSGLPEEKSLQDDYQKALKRLSKTLRVQIHAVPARVIFRSLDTWSNAFWINVGEKDNHLYPTKIIAKNSPVLVGQSVVGVIDYVGKNQSRVRLITDAGLSPSVRAVRGGEQEALIAEEVELLLSLLQRSKFKGMPLEESQKLTELLNSLKNSLQPYKKTWYLAKGELQGIRRPQKRGGPFILKGSGFNYDFPDEEGEGRDLRTGKPLHGQGPAIPIVKAQDILITTGMDGVFPAGLKVASVSKVHLLKEGDYFYDLEAEPLAHHLQDLSLVFIIPPLEYDHTDNQN